MLKVIGLSLTLAIGCAVAADAAMVTPETATDGRAIVRVGEGCGPGFWRGPAGHCNPFNGPNTGNNRGTAYECPNGMHIGSGGARCQFNQ